MTILLTQFQSGFGVPNPSPFCMKGEILLKMAKLPYQIDIINDPRKSPKGKLPFITDKGEIIADSALIRHHLEQKYGADFDVGLSDKQKATSHAFARMIEERLYWILVYGRWIDDSNWPLTSNFWFGTLPPILRTLIPIVARKQVRKNIKAHGIGTHSEAEIYAFAEKDLEALSVQLGDQDYMFGDVPSSLDSTAYPLIINAMIEDFPGSLLDAVKSHDNFGPYVERCQNIWFPDF